MYLAFSGLYNDWGTILLMMPGYPTFAYGVMQITTSTKAGLTTVPIRIASAMTLVIPISLLFMALRKKLFISINIGGIKG